MVKINNVNFCPFCGNKSPKLLSGYTRSESCKVVNLLHCDSCNYTFVIEINEDLK